MYFQKNVSVAFIACCQGFRMNQSRVIPRILSPASLPIIIWYDISLPCQLSNCRDVSIILFKTMVKMSNFPAKVVYSHYHSISKRTFWCFYCIIAMVHRNSPTLEIQWGRFDGKPKVGQYGIFHALQDNQYGSVHCYKFKIIKFNMCWTQVQLQAS